MLSATLTPLIVTSSKLLENNNNHNNVFPISTQSSQNPLISVCVISKYTSKVREDGKIIKICLIVNNSNGCKYRVNCILNYFNRIYVVLYCWIYRLLWSGLLCG